MLCTLVKAGSLTNLTDARYFSAFGIQWAGFCFDPESPHYIEPQAALEIKNWLHGPSTVGEFRHQDAQNIAAIAEFVGLDAIQINSDDLEAALAVTGLPVLLEVKGSESDIELSSLPDRVTHFLFDGRPHEWAEQETLIKRLSAFRPVLLDDEFSAGNMTEVLSRLQPDGLNLHGGREEKVGVKLFERLDAVMAVLETEH